MRRSLPFPLILTLLVGIGAVAVVTALVSLPVGLAAAVVVLMAVLAVGERCLLRPVALLTQHAERLAAGTAATETNSPRLPALFGRLAGLLVAVGKVLSDQQALAETRAKEITAQAATAVHAEKTAQHARKKDEARRQGMLGAGETLEEVADTIKKAAADLRDETRQVTAGAEEQRECVDETAQAVEIMVGSVTEVAQGAAQAAQAADQARQRATDGAAVVDTSVTAIGKVSDLSATLTANLSELGRQAESIGQVMTVISDIADQTNLLALNAAIEAARAGEAGRGFAVVADEVRKLAEKTMTATKEVGSVIKAIQEGTFDNIRHMEQASVAVATATDLAGQSRDALGEIVRLSGDAADQVRTIASASDEQVAASERIKTAIERIRDLSGRTTDGMVRSSGTIETLGGQIEELIKLNGVFKLIGQGEAQDAVEALAAAPDMVGLRQEAMERLMRQTLADKSFLELLYATDARGVQITENIAPARARIKQSGSVRGTDWSGRPWFTACMENRDTAISPIYVSQASGEYCLTISTPIFAQDRIVGVLGADIKVFG